MLLLIISSTIFLYSIVIYINFRKECKTPDSKIYQDKQFFKTLK